jgi:pentatricopeptide repeat protein
MVFSTLVKAFAQRKEMNRAMELYEEMGKHSASCTLVTYNTLIDACARVGEMEKASMLFRDMCERGVDPDLITYSTVIKGYCVQGDLEQAVQLFTLMQKRSIKPDAILFNSILDGCARKKMRTLTEEVLCDMEKAGVPPSNFTLSILVKLYGRCRDIEEAFKVVETLPKKYGFEVNATVYTCLMSSCISNGRLDKALEVFAKMKEAKKCEADPKTYETLIKGCVQQGDLEQAVTLIDDALGLDGQRKGPMLKLDPEAIDHVLFMIGRRSKTQELGAPLMERLQKAGIEVSKRAGGSASRSPVGGVGSSSRFHARRQWN